MHIKRLFVTTHFAKLFSLHKNFQSALTLGPIASQRTLYFFNVSNVC